LTDDVDISRSNIATPLTTDATALANASSG
jgi:hypothetical protein